MSEPKITAKVMSYQVQVDLLGTDDQGRPQYRCPSPGCGETGYFDADGRGHCPIGDAQDAFFAEAYETLKAALEPEGTVPDWAKGAL